MADVQSRLRSHLRDLCSVSLVSVLEVMQDSVGLEARIVVGEQQERKTIYLMRRKAARMMVCCT